MLDLSPCHQPTMMLIRDICNIRAQHVIRGQPYTGEKLESRMFSSASTSGELSPAQAVYTLEVRKLATLTHYHINAPLHNGHSVSILYNRSL